MTKSWRSGDIYYMKKILGEKGAKDAKNVLTFARIRRSYRHKF